MILLYHRDTCNRADPYTEPSTCFSDFSDSLNSLDSMKVLLHLEKTPLLHSLHLVRACLEINKVPWGIGKVGLCQYASECQCKVFLVNIIDTLVLVKRQLLLYIAVRGKKRIATLFLTCLIIQD